MTRATITDVYRDLLDEALRDLRVLSAHVPIGFRAAIEEHIAQMEAARNQAQFAGGDHA